MPRSRVGPPLGVWPRLTPPPPGRASPPPCCHANGATVRPFGPARLSLPRHPPPQHHPNNVLVILALFIAVALVHTLPWRKQVGPAALVERNEQVGAVVTPRLVHPGRVQLRLGHLHDWLGGWGGGEKRKWHRPAPAVTNTAAAPKRNTAVRREKCSQQGSRYMIGRLGLSTWKETTPQCGGKQVVKQQQQHKEFFLWMPPDHPAHVRANQTRVSPPTKLAAQGAARRGRHAKTYRHDPHRHPSQPSRCQKKEATTEAASPTVAVLGIPVAPRARTAAGSGETRQRERTRVRKRRAGGMRQSHVRRQWPGLRSGRN